MKDDSITGSIAPNLINAWLKNFASDFKIFCATCFTFFRILMIYYNINMAATRGADYLA